MERHNLTEGSDTWFSRLMARIVCQDKRITFCATVHDRATHSRFWKLVEVILDRVFHPVEKNHCRSCWEREVERHWGWDE